MFILLGIISILGQVVLLRELTTLFYGSEMFYGFSLALWLLFTGLGSLWAGKQSLSKKSRIIFLITLSLLLPLLIIGLRWFIGHLVYFGQLPTPRQSFLALVLSLFIFCFPLGAAFPLLLGRLKQKTKVNLAYFKETIGFALGGLIFSLVLATTTFPLTDQLNRLSLSWRYPDLISHLNSRYNQIIVTQSQDQQAFFLNGRLSFTSAETLNTNQLLSLLVPWSKELDSALVLGNPNLARQLQSQFINQLDYLQTDPQLLELEKPLLGNSVTPVAGDLRRFLKLTPRFWDLIISSLGNPETLLTNRYYTRENFLVLKKHLTPGGVAAVIFSLPTDYQSQEALRFAASIFQAFNSTFPHTRLLAHQGQIILLGSQDSLQLYPHLLPPASRQLLELTVNDPQNQIITQALQLIKVPANTDLNPSAFFYQQLFFQTIFSFKFPQLLSQISFILPFILIFLFYLLLRQSSSRRRLGWLTAMSGFIFISLVVLTIFLFQIKIGYLYQQLSLILASALTGMALGVKLKSSAKTFSQLSWFGYLILILVLALSLSTGLVQFSWYWFVFVFLVGLNAGCIYAQLNQLYLQRSAHLSFIYSFDLFGGSLGALLTTSFILPVYGVAGLLVSLTAVILLASATHPE
ncbi:hypothetical protein KKE48_04585 [Patescibacteria group bacterium]|nr:hypothetical protein [Patescibacteria group bacterium]MBU1500115.1 hypothetical protein [Patescibacteria group bacterium]